MRVCQPAPVAFHRSMASVGSRKEISLRGLVDTGLPPLLTFARALSKSRRLAGIFERFCLYLPVFPRVYFFGNF